MPQYKFSSILANEILYGRSLPSMWKYELGVNYLDRASPIVLEKLHLDFGNEHVAQILVEAPDVTESTMTSYLSTTGWTPCDTTAFANTVSRDQVAIDTFFVRYFNTTPAPIRVHLTKIGRGGSYHPLYQHWLSQQEPAISIRPDRRKEQPLFIIVHETVHLAINASVDNAFPNKNRYRIKEAIVDQVLSSGPGRKLIGENSPRPGILDDLPIDWRELPCFREVLD